jgi:hypothetical protein
MDIKYIAMDIHKETISIAVMNGEGKVVMESIIETKASTILQCIQGVHGDLHVTFEEGTWAAWLYDLLKPHVTKLVVCAFPLRTVHSHRLFLLTETLRRDERGLTGQEI